MSLRIRGLAVALTSLLMLIASSAEAARAVARVSLPGVETRSSVDEGVGNASAALGEFFAVRAEAAAYEYVGGVGTFARVGVDERIVRSGGQAGAGAEFSDNFTIQLGGMDLGPGFDGLFTLEFAINPSGSVTAFTSHPDEPSYSSARFDYGYSVGGVTGGDRAFYTRNFDGSETMLYANGPPSASVRLAGLRLGTPVPIRLFATAEVEAIVSTNGGGITAIADFSHTLRWGGVTSVSATDSLGNPLALPDNFELSLIGGSGFNYWRAAGLNPALGDPVPEPGTWALMVIGFWGVGSMLRRRPAIASV